MKPAPLVAVVILNWNGKRFLQQFLPSVTASLQRGYELIVADNASTDDSIEFLRQQYPSIRIIDMDVNRGFAGGYNEALKQVEAKYYLLLNSDVEVTPGWIEPMVDLMEKDATISACQPKIRSHIEPSLFEYAGAAGGWIDRYGYPFSKGRIFEVCEKDTGQYDQPEPIFWASGAAMFIRSEAFHSAKGFDAYFFAHQEEIDLCWRIQLSGGRIYSCPASVVFHVGGGTLPRGNSNKTFLNFRNNHIMLWKNLPWKEKCWIIPFRIGLDAITAWKGLLTGDGGFFLAILKAHLGFIRWIYFGRNESPFPPSRSGKLMGRFRGNLVWQHFIRKKNTFSRIVEKSN